MFETSNTTVYARPNRFTVFEAVTFSLIVHAAAIAVAVGANLWNVAFPDTSPAMMIAFNLADPTPPPPPPPPPRAVARPLPTVQPAAARPDETLAPTVIPDEIPIVQTQIVAAAVTAAPAGVVGGVDWGTIGGLIDGDLGGKIGGVAGSVSDIDPADHRVHIARDTPLPMFPVSQVYPSYPEDARLNSWEDDMVVRYIIGKDGRIKNVSILRAPQHDIFIDETLRAIRSWRFKPMVREGEKREVVHELTVQYRLHQEG